MSVHEPTSPVHIFSPPLTPAALAKRKPQHISLAMSLVLLVILPAAVVAGYMFAVAKDQFSSTMGFAVRTEDVSVSSDIFGSLAGLSSIGATDTDILYEFIQSAQLVRAIDIEVDLRGNYSEHYSSDPVFAFDPSGTIEDLTDYWQRMVKIFYDSGTGLIEIRVNAFEADAANVIANAIFEHSASMINKLSAIAREDAIRYAQEDLDFAIERLKSARQNLSQFRSRTQIIDPQADLQGQMGVINTLQQNLATALIEIDLLRETSRITDPRIVQAELRIAVIRNRIEKERSKFGSRNLSVGDDYVEIIGEFERLNVDAEFAERAYVSALAAYDSANAEALRTSRYLAAYLEPRVAEQALYPQRLTVVFVTAAFLLLVWSIMCLIYYSIRDRG
jgi:capsular polysaccharide transport system permease protein